MKTVKTKLIQGIFNRPPEELLNTDLKAFLHESFLEANKAIFQKGRQEPDMEGMGTTIVTMLVHKEFITIGHVGDSRGYLYRNGKLKAITRDHSLVQELIDDGKITQEQAAIHPNRNVITRALGVDAEVVPDTDRFPILEGDTFLAASDGLVGFTEESAIKKAFVDFVVEGKSPDLPGLANRLLELAFFGGGGDNISIALYHHKP